MGRAKEPDPKAVAAIKAALGKDASHAVETTITLATAAAGRAVEPYISDSGRQFPFSGKVAHLSNDAPEVAKLAAAFLVKVEQASRLRRGDDVFSATNAAFAAGYLAHEVMAAGELGKPTGEALSMYAAQVVDHPARMRAAKCEADVAARSEKRQRAETAIAAARRSFPTEAADNNTKFLNKKAAELCEVTVRTLQRWLGGK